MHIIENKEEAGHLIKILDTAIIATGLKDDGVCVKNCMYFLDKIEKKFYTPKNAKKVKKVKK